MYTIFSEVNLIVDYTFEIKHTKLHKYSTSKKVFIIQTMFECKNFKTKSTFYL